MAINLEIFREVLFSEGIPAEEHNSHIVPRVAEEMGIDLKALREAGVNDDTALQMMVEESHSAEGREPILGGRGVKLIDFESPLKSMGGVDKFLAGAGSAMTDVALGAQQIANDLRPISNASTIASAVNTGLELTGLGSVDEVRAELEEEALEKAKVDAPLLEESEALAGAITADVAMSAAIPVGGAAKTASKVFTNPAWRKAAESALTAGIQGFGLEAGKAVKPGEDRLQNAIEQGGFATATTGTLGMMGRYLGSKFDVRNMQKISETLKKAINERLDLDPAQAFGGAWVKVKENILAAAPTVEKQLERIRDQDSRFTAAVLRRAGIVSNTASPEVINNAFSTVSAKFDDLISRTTINVTPELTTNLKSVFAEANRMLGKESRKKFAKEMMGRIDLDNLPQTITGNSYSLLRKELTKAAATFSKPESNFKDVAKQIGGVISVLDDGVGDSIGAATKGEWAQTRKRWMTLSLLTDKKVITPDFNVDSNKFFSAVQGLNPRAFAKGNLGDIEDIARLGKEVISKKPSGIKNQIVANTSVVGAGTAIAGGNLGQVALSMVAFGAGKVLFQKGRQKVFNSQTLMKMLLNKSRVAGKVGPVIQKIEDEVGSRLNDSTKTILATMIRNIPVSVRSENLKQRED